MAPRVRKGSGDFRDRPESEGCLELLERLAPPGVPVLPDPKDNQDLWARKELKGRAVFRDSRDLKDLKGQLETPVRQAYRVLPELLALPVLPVLPVMRARRVSRVLSGLSVLLAPKASRGLLARSVRTWRLWLTPRPESRLGLCSR